jgi:hypothetical protein
MNAASLLLRILAIAGALAAGAFFYLDNGKLDLANSAVASAKETADAAQQTNNKNLADAQTQLAAAVDAIKATNEKLKTTTENSNIADSRVDGLKAENQSLQDGADAKDHQIKDGQSKISDLQSQVDGIADLQTQITGLQTQLTAANAIITQLQSAQSKPNTPDKSNLASGGENTDMVVEVPKNLSKASPAKILLVDTKNWLIALDVGSDAGVQKDSELYLKVGDENLAVIKILDTTASQSSAAIISTEDISPNKFSSIATKGLNVDYQTEVAQ